MTLFRGIGSTLRATIQQSVISSYFMWVSALQPLIFAGMFFLMFRFGDRSQNIITAAIGAAMMGLWSTTLFIGGLSIDYERWLGTLELLQLTPTPLYRTMMGKILAVTLFGTASMVLNMFFAVVVFRVPLVIKHPGPFVLSLALTILALSMMGLMLAALFTISRSASAFVNLLEYPIWFVAGLMFPLSLLPAWLRPLSVVLAPTWGIEALRMTALEPITSRLPLDLGMVVLLTIAYYLVARWLFARIDYQARVSGALSLY